MILREMHRFFPRPNENFEPAFNQGLIWMRARALNLAMRFPAATPRQGAHIIIY